MKIAFLEPHLRIAGGIRRVLELGNELAGRGHDVSYLLPSTESLRCDWMPCAGRIRALEDCTHEPFDALIFNDETQWSLVDMFSRASLVVYYLLHYAVLYDKPGSRESYRYPVDLRLANSNWTADRIAEEIGVRPVVVLGGINRKHFRPVQVRKKYDVLTYGSTRAWKGTADVEEACRRAGVRLEKYEGKGLPQEQMAFEYGKARVFVVGSLYEGFCQPGLEALACGTPLVTTDNGGCREYAVHEETALVVPPGNPEAMAEAIRRLTSDQELAARLRRNGLKLVAEKFDGWEAGARHFETLLTQHLEARRQLTLAMDRADPDPKLETLRRTRAAQVATYTRTVPLPGDAPASAPPKLVSLITLSWDQPYYTQQFVESVRANTDLPYELIIVDNGSRPETRELVPKLADKSQLNPENVGFARGMNQGAALAQGEYLVFINNDTSVPPGWLRPLVETAQREPRAGVVAPAVTASGSFITVRAEPHPVVREILPFSLSPAAVCYLVPRAALEAVGGWCEEYRLGGAEDVDLCFSLWARGWKVLLDERVLLVHHSKGTAAAKLEDWQEIWRRNRELLIDRWSAAEPAIAAPADPDAGLWEQLAAVVGESGPAAALVAELRARRDARAEAAAVERARMACGVMQSWREALRQRQISVGLRRQLASGVWRQLYRRYVTRRGKGPGAKG